jgi:hypothetical protein
LGGIDLNRFVPNDISFDLASGFQPVIAINAISVSSNPLSTAATKPTWSQSTLQQSAQAELYTIDTSTPFLWLPEKVCDAFAQSLNLTYNQTLQLYLYSNGTDPSALTDWNLNFTFTLADLPGSSKSLDISLPFNAFNHQLSFPFPALNATYGSPAVNYFPIRKAANNTQYTIGRVFLQEAYLAVDYERNNFSISQAKFANDAVTNVKLAGIKRPANSIFAGPKTGMTKGMSTGAKAGIGIGIAVLAIVVIGLVAFFCLRKRGRDEKTRPDSPAEKKGFWRRRPNADVKGSAAEASELLGDKRQPQEVAADKDNTRFELPGNAPVEMPAEVPFSYYALDKARYRNAPAELEHHDSNAKNSLSPRDANRSSSSPSLPPYSPAQVGKRPGQNISPSSTYLNSPGAGAGTMSSGVSGISPNSASPNTHPRRSSYGLGAGSPSNQAISPPEPSPLMPPTPLDHPNSRSSLNLPRSRDGEGSIPSRSVSRGSRFREEGISGESQPQPQHKPGPVERKFSWEDGK